MGLRESWLGRLFPPRAGKNRRRSTVHGVDARSTERHRLQVSRTGKALFVVVVVVLAGLALWAGARAAVRSMLSANPEYTVRELDIRSDGRVVTPDKVKEWTQLRPGMNLFAFDLRRVRDDLLKRVPIVKGFEATRVLPDRLEVRIAERIPVARLGSYGYLGADGAGVAFSIPPSMWNLPGITGFSEQVGPGGRVSGRILSAIDVIEVCNRTMPGTAVRILSVDVREPDCLVLTLPDDARARLAWPGLGASTPESRLQIEGKLRNLARILEAAAGRHKRVRSVDLTFTDDYIPVDEY